MTWWPGRCDYGEQEKPVVNMMRHDGVQDGVQNCRRRKIIQPRVKETELESNAPRRTETRTEKTDDGCSECS